MLVKLDHLTRDRGKIETYIRHLHLVRFPRIEPNFSPQSVEITPLWGPVLAPSLPPHHHRPCRLGCGLVEKSAQPNGAFGIVITFPKTNGWIPKMMVWKKWTPLNMAIFGMLDFRVHQKRNQEKTPSKNHRFTQHRTNAQPPTNCY